MAEPVFMEYNEQKTDDKKNNVGDSVAENYHQDANDDYGNKHRCKFEHHLNPVCLDTSATHHLGVQRNGLLVIDCHLHEKAEHGTCREGCHRHKVEQRVFAHEHRGKHQQQG